MKQKKALVKLAQVRLAINHVLRQRMVKKAQSPLERLKGEQPDILSLMNEAENTINGEDRLDGAHLRSPLNNAISTPLNSLKNTITNSAKGLWNKYITPYNNPDYIKPEFQYLTQIGTLFNEQPNHTNNMLGYKDNIERQTGYSALPFFAPRVNSYNHAYEDPFQDYTYPPDHPSYKWKELAHRASLPSWHPDHASKEEVNQVTNAFYDAYNGQRSNLENGQYIAHDNINKETGYPSGITLNNLPMYPIEGINYNGNTTDWWNSWVNRISKGGYGPAEMDYDWEEIGQ